MIKFKVICEREDQYIDACFFERDTNGDLILLNEDEIMVAMFQKDYWKAIRVAFDYVPLKEKEEPVKD